MPASAPYGSWESPITAEEVARGGVRLSEPWPAPGGGALWLERRAAEGGRSVIVRREADGSIADVTPQGFNVRTRAHEYGGGAWLPVRDAVVFSNFADQRLYRQDGVGADPVAITPEPPEPASIRYADARATPGGATLVCVRETHPPGGGSDPPPGGGEAANELVALPADGSAEPRVLASGRDFYAFPRVSPDGARVAWTCWDHPNMPWDGCELWVTPLDAPADAQRVAGGPEEAIWQPEWSPDGVLHWVSDADGFWNLYRAAGGPGGGGAEQLTRERADLGYPQWLFGGATFAFLDGGAIACIRTENAVERLCLLEEPGASGPIDLGLSYSCFAFPGLRSGGARLLFTAASPSQEPAVVELDTRTREPRVIRAASDHPLDPAYAPEAREIEFPTGGGLTAHAFYYPPRNPRFEGPEGELPPLIVQSHGGPTGHVSPQLQIDIAFWTSRGVGVVDVNYGGSTGFGREYRSRLDGTWGIVDTGDCINAARHLADTGEVDGNRLAIHGGSAGGYTTLCALVFHDVFAAGASSYGVADAETLAQDTHKFESRYLDRLIGPYPEAKATYKERSPIHSADRLNVPVILFQGLEDEVVPPSQAEAMVAALRANGVPHAYLPFEGEQHGFRKAETIVRCLEAELSFYAQVFGFEPAGSVEPVQIERP